VFKVSRAICDIVKCTQNKTGKLLEELTYFEHAFVEVFLYRIVHLVGILSVD